MRSEKRAVRGEQGGLRFKSYRDQAEMVRDAERLAQTGGCEPEGRSVVKANFVAGMLVPLSEARRPLDGSVCAGYGTRVSPPPR